MWKMSYTVRDIMTRDVKTVRIDDTVRDAVRKMVKFRIGSVIVRQADRPVGIITERDVLQKMVEPCLDPASVSARMIMSTPLIAISPSATLEEAARLMAGKGIKKLVVMERGKLVGVITTTDIARVEPKLVGSLRLEG